MASRHIAPSHRSVMQGYKNAAEVALPDVSGAPAHRSFPCAKTRPTPLPTRWTN